MQGLPDLDLTLMSSQIFSSVYYPFQALKECSNYMYFPYSDAHFCTAIV